MAAVAQINANCLNMQFFMSSVNLCKSVSKQYNLPSLPKPPGHSKLNAVRCPLNAVILQNEPNFGKMENEPNPLFGNDLRRNIPSPATRKTNPIEPNFQVRPPSHSSLNAERCPLNAVILQNEPNHLFAKDLRKNHPSQISRFGVQFSPIQEHKRLFQAISRAIRDNSRQFETIGANSRQAVLSQEPALKSEGKSGAKQ
jgi:hypothetical protein